jgi:sugar lactone lactonase YvrE
VKANGVIFFADTANHVIRKIAKDGTVSLYAGTPGVAGNTDGTGEVAQFHSPNGLAFDANNNLYVADTGNALIRMIAPQGVVTTVAGTNGEFEAPFGIAIDSTGLIYVSDRVQNTILNVNATNGNVSIYLGTADTAGSNDGQGASATFNGPTGIAFDSSDDLWIADTLNGTIREADTTGTASTVDGLVGQLATVDGDPTTAQFNSPIGLAIDSNDDVYISDQVDNVIRVIDPSTFVVTTVAGSLKWMKTNKNTTTFNGPEGLAFTSKNVLIIADTQNGMIRQMTEKNESVTDVAGAGGATTAGDNANPVLGMVIDSQGNTFYTQGNKIKKLDVNGNSTVFAGGSKGNADGNGAVATFSAPSGIGIDSNDYLYVADTGNNLIRQISPSADVITYAGNLKKAKRDIDANGVLASFLSPVGITVDAGGTVYVSESLGFTIRAIDTSGNVTTLAGSNNNDGWVDGKGNKAEFETPGAMVADSSGNIFVVDAANDVIRKVNPSGKVTTFAGAGLTPGTVDGIGTSAMFEGLSGITIDGLDNLYVTQTTGAIRKITPARVVTTLMVDSQQLSASSIDGDADVGRLGTPTAITVDYNGNLIFADANLTSIREYTSLASLVSPHLGGTPVISVPIPSPAPSSAVPINYGSIKTLGGFTGYVDGAAADARFNQPTGVAYDSLGNLFIVDSGNQVIRKMDTSGNVTLFAGSPGNPGYADGQGSAAQFTGPYAIAFNSAGNMFVTDTGNDLIRMITPGGLVSTYAGDGAETSTDGNGINAEFDDPRGITIDGNDNIYVSDEGSNLIRLINTNGDVSTLAGNGTGSSDGQGVNASFSQPMGIFSIASSLLVADLTNNELRYIDSNANVTTFVDPNSYLDNPIAVTADQNGNTFVLNQEGSTIEMIDSNGNSSILAGISRTFGSTDGNASTALFFGSMGITTDPSGNVIVADTDNNTIRKITPAGMTTTIAGRAPATYPTPAPLIPGAKKETQVRVTADVNGTGDRAILGQVMGMATDSNGNIFMTTSFDTIRKITPSGVVTTFAGSGLDGDTDGTGTAAAFSDPIGIAIDSANNLYVADSGNSAIRKITPSGVVTTLGAGLNARIKATPNQNGPVQTYDFSNPTGIAVTSSGVIYVSDNGTNTVDFIATDGTETVFAGDGTSNFADGNGVSAEFNNPYSIIFDGSGNLIVVDAGNNAIRQINSNGEVTTIAGKNSPWDGADGYDYTTFTPIGITMDAHGDFEIATIGNGGPTYLVQTYVDNDRFTSGSLGGIQKIDPSGVLTPVAGVPVAQLNAPLPPNLISKVLDNNGLYTGQSSTDGDLPLAQSIPTSIATDRAGNVIMGSAITGFENFYVLRNAKYLDSGLLDTRSPVLTDLTDAVRTPVLTAEDTDLPLYNELGIGELGSIRVLLRAP